MLLAALSFADPLMLAGLVAALVPVALHLLNRVRAPVVPFSTLRFLKITAQKTARRRQVQQYFLLLLRVIVFMLIAMAVAAPLIRGGAAPFAYSLVIILFAALALLVLSAVATAAALDRARSPSPAPSSPSIAQQKPTAKINGPKAAPPAPATFWALSFAALLTAAALAAFSLYGLFSDHFFSADRGVFSGNATALVILLDNSQSMLVREEGRTRLDRAKESVRQLLTQTLHPAEAAVLPTNPADTPSANILTSDTTRLLGELDSLQPRGRAQPMRERIRTALQILETSREPSKILLLLGDFARPTFADADVFANLKTISFRKDLQVVLMPIGKPEGGGGAADVGITGFTLAESSERPAIGAQLTFEATLINNSDSADVRDFAFTVDGEPVEGISSRVAFGAAGTPTARTTLRIPYRLREQGSHRFGLRLENAQDSLAWDDQRELVLDIADQIKVLVIGNEDAPANPGAPGGPRARSAAFYLQAALAPYATRPATRPGVNAAGITPWSIQPAYRGVNQVRDAAALAGYAAVFACDLPVVPPPLADGLAAYVKTGGRLIWILGPSVNATAYNDTLLGAANAPVHRALLPAPLGQPIVTATAAPIEWVDLHSGIFANLFDSVEPFRATLVTGHWLLADDLPANARPLAKLPDNVTLFTQHAPFGSRGQVYTLLTTPASAWSNLGATALLVPMASRMAMGDATEALADTSFETGQPVLIHVPPLDSVPNAAAISLDVTTPENAIVNARVQSGSGAAGGWRWLFDRTYTAGIYHWKSSDGRFTGMFAVNPPGDEADLLPADVDALARESSPAALAGGKATLVAATPDELMTQLQGRSEGTSLVPGFLAMVLILAVVEALMANRYRGS